MRVSTPKGELTVRAAVTEGMVDHVVWLPTNSEGSAVRSVLGVDAGAVVTLTALDSNLEVSS